MISEFEQNIKNHGPAGQEWFKRIPDITSKLEKKWNLKVESPFDLTWNYVAPVIQADGTAAVIKIGFPQDPEFKSEIAALEIFNGNGIEKLLAEDKDNCAILIERVMPGVPLSQMEDDEKSTKIIAGVMKKLWKPLPENHPFANLTDWTKAIPDLKAKYTDGKYPHFPAFLVDKADALLHELIETADEPVLLHGDLHQDNILSSERDMWLAIDPKGVAGERAFEVGAMIRNPYKKMDKNPRMKEIMQRRIEIMSDELGIDKQRIYKWCLAQTVLSAVWSIDDQHNRWEHSLNTALVLNEINW